jgi:glycine cleavage system aminomethyltransferase T
MAPPSSPNAVSKLRLPLHHWHVAHGARMIDLDGWQIPASYDGEREPSATSLSFVDLSAFAKVSLRGSGVAAATGALLGDTPAAKSLGVTTLAGNILACRLTEEHLLLLGNGPRLELRMGDFDLRISAQDFDCQCPQRNIVVANATSAFAGFVLIGSSVERILSQVIAADLSAAALPKECCIQTNLMGVAAVLVRTQECTSPSVRVYVSWDLGEYVWENLMTTGRAWNVTPLGLESWNSRRKR